MVEKVVVTVALAALAVLSSPYPAYAQQASTASRIGYLCPISRPETLEVFRQELHRRGYVEGKNIFVEYRSAEGDFQRLAQLATELVGLKVDAIVAERTQAALAARKATTTVPIVMVGVGDPLGAGLVASLSHPGGNVTGTSSVSSEVIGKQLQVLHELLPGASRVAVLWNPGNAVFQQQLLTEAKANAAQLRFQLQLVDARTPQEIDRAFMAIGKAKPDAVLVLADPLFVSQAKRIAGLAIEQRLPAVSGTRVFAEAGGVATYGFEVFDDYRRAAGYIDRILRGAKPADLPVEQSTRAELVINAKTARVLGLTIPKALSTRADQIIE
jgi:putative ABC transport system substrate-binding protein